MHITSKNSNQTQSAFQKSFGRNVSESQLLLLQKFGKAWMAMVDFSALSDKTYFITHRQGIKQFHKLEATADGIQLYVRCDGKIEAIGYSDISYIISANKPEYFGIADNFIQFIKKDLADTPLLFDFMLALWNADYDGADKIAAVDEGIAKKLLAYMDAILELKDFNALLTVVFANYMRFKSNNLT